MQSFGAAVECVNGTQLMAPASRAVEPAQSVLTSSELVRTCGMHHAVKQCPAKLDSVAKPVHLPSSTAARWSGVRSAGEVLDWPVTDAGVADACKCPVQWSVLPDTGSSGHVLLPLLRTAAVTTTSAGDVSDEPQDLSVRTGSRHVTSRHVTSADSRPTVVTNSRLQLAQPTGEVHTRKVQRAMIANKTRKPS